MKTRIEIMKISLPALIGFACLFSGCEKHAEITKQDKTGTLHAITFGLNGFTRHTEIMSEKLMSGKTGTHSISIGPTLEYFAYDGETGKIVSSQRKIAESKDYGVFTDSLPAGKYDIVFVGHWDDPDHSNPTDVFNSEHFDEAYVLNTYEHFTYIIPEIFFKHIKIDVSEDVVIGDIKLPREVGEIEVRFTDDTFPDSTTVLIQYQSHFTYPFRKEFVNTINSELYLESQINSDQRVSGYVIPDPETGKLTTEVKILAYSWGSYGEDTIAYKTIENIEIKANKRTILSGKLFDETDLSQSFTVKVDTAWTDEAELEF